MQNMQLYNLPNVSNNAHSSNNLGRKMNFISAEKNFTAGGILINTAISSNKGKISFEDEDEVIF